MYDALVTDEAPDALERARALLMVVDVALGIAITASVLWELKKDDPLGWPAQVRRRVDGWRRARLRKRREAAELANWSIELALFLERWLNKEANQ